jgi:CRP/FNR family transcriptional regulator, cyclic AMP receptor protein
LDVAEKARFDVGDIWLFSACSGSQLRTIRRAIDEIAVDGGKVLCDEGSVGREFFYIVEGTATVRRAGKKLATLGPGSYFGELSLLDRKPRSATVVSDTDMVLLVLEQRRFNGLLTDMPALAHKLLVAMAQRLRDADAKAIN